MNVASPSTTASVSWPLKRSSANHGLQVYCGEIINTTLNLQAKCEVLNSRKIASNLYGQTKRDKDT